ncbi:MAG: hypothetical protein ABRQ29_07330, partial [Smithellaceae bacterium]
NVSAGEIVNLSGANELQANPFTSGISANNVPGAPFRNNHQKTIAYKFFIISRRYIFVRCEKNRT